MRTYRKINQLPIRTRGNTWMNNEGALVVNTTASQVNFTYTSLTPAGATADIIMQIAANSSTLIPIYLYSWDTSPKGSAAGITFYTVT
jgi:hypothetical protein